MGDVLHCRWEFPVSSCVGKKNVLGEENVVSKIPWLKKKKFVYFSEKKKQTQYIFWVMAVRAAN